ncbi:MAG: 4,5-DOPA dioxygenase extradiol [Bryobacterales bacterium]|nr:4,5-DOPA dioxygenase extradiol [Bryobacterales bacterium]
MKQDMPAMFAGHGSPMNAIEDNRFRRGMHEAAQTLPRPEAILCISAHWETEGVCLTASPAPATIHDFYGFPKALHEARYPAPGHPALARRVAGLLPGAQLDESRGFDHGCWGVLLPMYPDAQIPVVQLSLDRRLSAQQHYALARSLAPLREEGILILGSGNIVHNLGRIGFHSPQGAPWAVRFNRHVKQCILDNGIDALAAYDSFGPEAALSVPTPEHFLPLLYVLAVRRSDDHVQWFNDAELMNSLSMTSFVLTAKQGD